MNLKNLFMWMIIILLSVGLFNMFQSPDNVNSAKSKVPFSKFLKEVDDGRVIEVEIQGNNIKGVYSNGNSFSTYAPNDPNLIEKLSDKGVSISAAPLEEKNVKRRVFLFEVPLKLYLKMNRYLHIGRVRVPHRICTVRDNTPII